MCRVLEVPVGEIPHQLKDVQAVYLFFRYGDGFDNIRFNITLTEHKFEKGT